MSTELTIVVPAYNERQNVAALLECVSGVLEGIRWELIFVDDDSPDGTAELVRQIANNNNHVRIIQRLGRRGLSSACIEGILASASPYILIMDADLQHDEKIIPDMLSELKCEGTELVIGSRYITGGSTGGLPDHRVRISQFATSISNYLLKHPVKDPMSGFFMFRRDFFEKNMRKLSGKGFKILFDILVNAGGDVSLKEVPYTMRERDRGESKLSTSVAWEFFAFLIDKFLGKLLPIRFINFTAVGFTGVFVHLFVLWIIHRLWSVDFIFAQSAATLVAMTSNYILNNRFTYRDKKLHGWQFYRGLLSFYLACSVGAIINVAFADKLFDLSFQWWLAGLSGAVAGAVWNYAVTAVFTWGRGSQSKV